MNIQSLKERIVTVLNTEITTVTSYDAEKFSEIDLPNISVKVASCERMSKALRSYSANIEITLRAHSGDSLTVSQINAVTNDIESLLNDEFASEINNNIANLQVDYFAHNGGVPDWTDNALECKFDCEVIFQTA